MLEVQYTSRFKKDYKLIKKRKYDIQKLKDVISILCNCECLPQKFKDHELSGDYKGFRECHIEPDWLLIYKISDNTLILTLTRTGTHSDLFQK